MHKFRCPFWLEANVMQLGQDQNAKFEETTKKPVRYCFLIMHSFNLINDPTSSFYMLHMNQYALATSPPYALLDNHLKFKLQVSHSFSSILVSFHCMSTIFYQFQIKFLFHISDILKSYASTSVTLVISLYCFQTGKNMFRDINFAQRFGVFIRKLLKNFGHNIFQGLYNILEHNTTLVCSYV